MSAKYTFLAWDTPITNAPLKLALLQLANNADDDGFSYYSISKMSIACGMSERTFMRKIVELEKMNVLTVERRANRPSLYSLIGDEMGVSLCHLQTPGVTESHPGVTESHLEGDRESPDPNNTPNTTLNSITYCPISDVLNHLNMATGSKYRATTKSHSSNINARLKDYSVDELKSVIDFKTGQWFNDPKMVGYLRPQTLFSAAKFDGYLVASRSAIITQQQSSVDVEQLEDQFRRSQEAKQRREERAMK